MYDIRRMQMLLEIHERGTIISAAHALNLTPSAVSQQITNLEKEAGTALLQRVGRRVQLTSAGLVVIETARRILREVDRMQTSVATLAGEPAGTVRLAIFQSASFALLPRTLAYLHDHAPRLVLQVLQIDPETGISMTRSREYDMVIAESYPHHYIPEYPELHSELLVEDPLSLIVPADSPIRSLHEARHIPWVLEREENTSRRWAVNQCRAAGFEPEIRYSANDMITNVNLVRAGFAASIVPGFILASLSNPEGLRVVDLPGAPYRSIFTAVRADAVTTPALAMVREAMRYAVSEAFDS
ncbi:LysR family transcriptional regulator [Rothia aeria]|uniref:LysR family transcriptional regulator n=1 Tax=Rothia aeria TaxID=172042 RepID=UPI0028EB975F|nr:LysR family transcriptional regulator [Rothia aeria]